MKKASSIPITNRLRKSRAPFNSVTPRRFALLCALRHRAAILAVPWACIRWIPWDVCAAISFVVVGITLDLYATRRTKPPERHGVNPLPYEHKDFTDHL